jgi:predicted AAA+ superfamily ATPase
VLQISQADIDKRLSFDNPWWTAGSGTDSPYRGLPTRSYLDPFIKLVDNRKVRRAIILLGPRRVGKTVILHQTIGHLLKHGLTGDRILYLSLDTPIYTATPLETFVQRFQQRFGHKRDTPLVVIFDEIQYLRDWEVHLKSLVDSFPEIRFVASGSAAAALRLKSRESGAGRFTEFLLPPLTFAEYLDFVKKTDELIRFDGPQAVARDIDALNAEFIQYLNVGGYPEAVFSEEIKNDIERFIKSDIIDKVLLRDLPQLYGIRDIQELNRLFTTLAYNTGNEVSLEELSQSSGVSKTTLSRYLEYLEAAFLVRRVYRIDQNAKRFKRATAFKVYLTNPSMRAALFGSSTADDQAMGALAETALYSQYFHNTSIVENLHYARWPSGEIDLVLLDQKTQKPRWATEVKWSDRPATDKRLLKHLVSFQGKNPGLKSFEVTTKTIHSKGSLPDGTPLELVPTAIAVYEVGHFALKMKRLLGQ